MGGGGLCGRLKEGGEGEKSRAVSEARGREGGREGKGGRRMCRQLEGEGVRKVRGCVSCEREGEGGRSTVVSVVRERERVGGRWTVVAWAAARGRDGKKNVD